MVITLLAIIQSTTGILYIAVTTETIVMEEITKRKFINKGENGQNQYPSGP